MKDKLSKLDIAIGAPFDLNWIVNDIFAHLDTDAIAAIEAMSKPADMYGHHFHGFLGMAARNEYGLWQDNALTSWFKETLGVYHGDDMSAIVQQAVWYRVHNQPYDPMVTVEECRQHWAMYGLTLDQTKIKDNPNYQRSKNDY